MTKEKNQLLFIVYLISSWFDKLWEQIKTFLRKSPVAYLITFKWIVFLFAWINQELKWLFHCSDRTEQGIHMRLPFEGFVVEVVFCIGFEGGERNYSADGDWKTFLSCLKYNMKWTMKLTSHNSLQRSAGLNWFHVLATKYSWSKMDYVEKIRCCSIQY